MSFIPTHPRIVKSDHPFHSTVAKRGTSKHPDSAADSAGKEETRLCRQLNALAAQIHPSSSQSGTRPDSLRLPRHQLQYSNIHPRHSFSSMFDKQLDKLEISHSGALGLKTDSKSRHGAAGTDAVGEDEHWSTGGLYYHLHFLEVLFHVR